MEDYDGRMRRKVGQARVAVARRTARIYKRKDMQGLNEILTGLSTEFVNTQKNRERNIYFVRITS